MAINRARLCLICYDIREPKRLQRVHRYLRESGLPVQYSVFTSRLTRKQQDRMSRGLRALIDERADDVRIYPLPEHGERHYLGRLLFPEDVMLLDQGGDLMV